MDKERLLKSFEKRFVERVFGPLPKSPAEKVVDEIFDAIPSEMTHEESLKFLTCPECGSTKVETRIRWSPACIGSPSEPECTDAECLDCKHMWEE